MLTEIIENAEFNSRILRQRFEAAYKNGNNIEALRMLFQSFMAYGYTANATSVIKSLQALGVTTIKLEAEKDSLEKATAEMKGLYQAEKYEHCVLAIEVALQVAPESFVLRLMKAKCFVRLNRLAEGLFLHLSVLLLLINFHLLTAQPIVDRLLLERPDDSQGIYLHGICLYFKGQIEESLRNIEKAIKCGADDHRNMKPKLKKMLAGVNEAQRLSDAKNYQEAIKVYSKEIEASARHCNWKIQLLMKRATAHMSKQSFHLALLDLNEVLSVQLVNAALLMRAICLFNISEFGKCIVDCKGWLKTGEKRDKPEVESLLKKAQSIQDGAHNLKKNKVKTETTKSVNETLQSNDDDVIDVTVMDQAETDTTSETKDSSIHGSPKNGVIPESFSMLMEIEAALKLYEAGEFEECFNKLKMFKENCMSTQNFKKTMDKAGKTSSLIRDCEFSLFY